MKNLNLLARFSLTVAAALAACLAHGQAANPFGPPPTMTPEMLAIVKDAAAKPTPHLADGTIDLGGYWQLPNFKGNFVFGPPQAPSADKNTINVFPPGATVANVNALDKKHADDRRANTALRPKYKPAYVAKANENFDKGDLVDPTYGCQLPGVVRLGLPSEIFERSGAVAVMYGGRLVETSGVDHIFLRPTHPYSEALLGCIPNPERLTEGPLPAIGGAPPDLSVLPSGCSFAPRCPVGRDEARCHEHAPRPIPVEGAGGRATVECHFAAERIAGAAA